MYTKLVTRYFNRRFVSVFFTLFLIAIPFITQSQLRYNFEYLNTENGLPTNAIKGLQFDEKNRFLWVATESGIVRYNGHGFQGFGDNEKTAVLNGRIVFFDKTIDGKLFGKLIDERVFTVNENNAIIDPSITKMDGEFIYLNYKYNLDKVVTKQAFFDIVNDIKSTITIDDIHNSNSNNISKTIKLLNERVNKVAKIDEIKKIINSYWNTNIDEIKNISSKNYKLCDVIKVCFQCKNINETIIELEK